jgi:hypothetical protein
MFLFVTAHRYAGWFDLLKQAALHDILYRPFALDEERV